MSDTSQGPDWWQASDGKWYPPDQASGGDSGAQFAGAGAGGGAVPASTSGTGAGVQSQWGTLAEWPQRAVGWLIDFALYVVLIIAINIVGFIIGQISSILSLLFSVVGFIAAIGLLIYQSKLEGETGQTIGKRLTGLKTVKEESGQVIGFGPAILRRLVQVGLYILCVIPFIVDMLFPLWDPKKQTIHDKVLSSIVVTGAPKQQFGPELFKP